MKILIIVLLFLIAMMMGCSNSDNRAFSLWEDRQMDDDQRIYGLPIIELSPDFISRPVADKASNITPRPLINTGRSKFSYILCYM